MLISWANQKSTIGQLVAGSQDNKGEDGGKVDHTAVEFADVQNSQC